MTSIEFEVVKALLELCGETNVKILDKQEIASANPLVVATQIDEAIQNLKSAEYISLKYSGSDEYCLSLTPKGISAFSAEKERLRRLEEERLAAEAKRLEEEKRRAEEERKRAEELARLEKLRQEEEARRERLRREEEERQERLRREEEERKGRGRA